MIAVLTADLVDSTQMSKEKHISVMAGLKGLLNTTKHKFDAPFDIYRGDGFQVLIPSPVDAMRACLLLKLGLLALADKEAVFVTQSLAVGSAEHIANSPAQSTGEVFTASGRGLEHTEKGGLSLHLSAALACTDLSLSTRFLNALLKRLSQKQALVLYHYILLDFPEQNLIAGQLKMTRQNVNTHLHRANADLVKAYLHAFETSISHAQVGS